MHSNTFHIEQATHCLNQGKVIAYPTESVYGLGCDPSNSAAIEHLLQLKSRSAAKGLILIASDISQLNDWVEFDQIPDQQSIIDSWPGHETWLIPAKKHVSTLLRGEHKNLAVRVSAHPVVQQLCQQFQGAIISTSANKQGQPEATTLLSAKHYFHQAVDYYVPGEVDNKLKPSRIRDGITGQIIRA